MNCSDAKAYLASFADGELDVNARAAIAAHAATCPACAVQIMGWQRLRRAVAHSMAVSTPVGLADRVRASLAKEHRSRVILPYRWLVRISAAAAVVMIAMLASFQLLRGDQQVSTVHAADFVAVHRLCAIETPHDARRVRNADPGLVAQRIHEEIDFNALVPNLSRDAYKFDGVCTCLRVGEAHTVHAFYRPESGDGPMVSIFSIDRPLTLVDASRTQTSRFGPRVYQTATVADVSLVEWRDGNGTYAMCSVMPLVDLMRLADDVSVGDSLTPESAGNVVR